MLAYRSLSFDARPSVFGVWIVAAVLLLSAPAHATEPAPAASSLRTPAPPLRDWLRWGGAGVALTGAAVGTVAGVISLSATSTAKSACAANQCPPMTWDDLRTARTAAVVSDIGFVTAGAGVAALIASFFVWPREKAAMRTASFTIVPSFGPAHASLSGTF